MISSRCPVKGEFVVIHVSFCSRWISQYCGAETCNTYLYRRGTWRTSVGPYDTSNKSGMYEVMQPLMLKGTSTLRNASALGPILIVNSSVLIL